MRLGDETKYNRKSVVQDLPAAGPPREPAALFDQSAFDDCTERALRAVVSRQFSLAISEFEKAQHMRPEDDMVKHRLEKLRKLREQQSG